MCSWDVASFKSFQSWRSITYTYEPWLQKLKKPSLWYKQMWDGQFFFSSCCSWILLSNSDWVTGSNILRFFSPTKSKFKNYKFGKGLILSSSLEPVNYWHLQKAVTSIFFAHTFDLCEVIVTTACGKPATQQEWRTHFMHQHEVAHCHCGKISGLRPQEVGAQNIELGFLILKHKTLKNLLLLHLILTPRFYLNAVAPNHNNCHLEALYAVG